MSANSGLRFLRPYLFTELPVTKKSAYIRFYNSTRRLANNSLARPETALANNETGDVKTSLKHKSTPGRGQIKDAKTLAQLKPRPEVKQRIEELEKTKALVYPRIEKANNVLTVAEYKKYTMK